MKALKILKSAGDIGFSAKQIIISSHRLNKAIKELEELQQSNQDLLNTIIEAQKVIKNVLECRK